MADEKTTTQEAPRQVTTDWTKSFGSMLDGQPREQEEIISDERPPDAGGGGNIPPDKAPAAPAAEAKPEAAQGTTDPQPDKWPRTAKEWKKFTEARDNALKERDAKIAQYEAKMKELDAAQANAKANFDTAEVDAIKKERDELSERMRLIAIERHPRFENYFKGQISAQIELAKEIVGTEQASAIEEALSLPNGKYKSDKLEELLSEMTPLQVSRMGGVLNQIRMIEREKAAEIEKAKADYQGLTQREQQAAETRRKEAENIFNEVAKSLQGKDGMAVFQLRDGDEAWNKQVEQSIAQAKDLLFSNQHKPDDLARAALKAAAFPAMLQMYSSLMDQNEKLQAQVKQLAGATPSIQPSAQSGAAKAPSTLRSGMTPQEAAKSFFSGIQQAMADDGS